jgi:hypothetical protein
MRLMLLMTALLTTAIMAAEIPRKVWQIETSEPRIERLDLFWGETIDLEFKLQSYKQTLDVAGAAVTLHARTNGMAQGYSFQRSGTAHSAGIARVRVAVSDWLPASASNGVWTLEITLTNSARIVRANGLLTVKGTAAESTSTPVPGYVYTELIARIEATNALMRAALTNEAALRAQGDRQSSNLVTASLASIPTPSADALRLVDSTNSPTRWQDGDGRIWRVDQVAETNVSCTFSNPFGILIAPDMYERPGESVYIAPLGAYQEAGGEWVIIFNTADNGVWEVTEAFLGLSWSATGTELPLIATGNSGECIGTATFDWHVTYHSITSHVDDVALASDLVGLGAGGGPSGIATVAGVGTNTAFVGGITLRNSQATNLVLRLVASNEYLIVEEVLQ